MDETQINYNEHEVANVVKVIMNMSNRFEIEDSTVSKASGMERWLLQVFPMT